MPSPRRPAPTPTRSRPRCGTSRLQRRQPNEAGQRARSVRIAIRAVTTGPTLTPWPDGMRAEPFGTASTSALKAKPVLISAGTPLRGLFTLRSSGSRLTIAEDRVRTGADVGETRPSPSEHPYTVDEMTLWQQPPPKRRRRQGPIWALFAVVVAVTLGLWTVFRAYCPVAAPSQVGRGSAGGFRSSNAPALVMSS
jgi:hypothetical protein